MDPIAALVSTVLFIGLLAAVLVVRSFLRAQKRGSRSMTWGNILSVRETNTHNIEITFQSGLVVAGSCTVWYALPSHAPVRHHAQIDALHRIWLRWKREGFGLCQPVRVATDPPSSSFQLGQEVQWWESWETWELVPSVPSRAAGIVANLDDRGVLVIPHVTVHPKSALFLHRIFVFPIPDGDNDPPDDKELWYTPERNSRRLNQETPTS